MSRVALVTCEELRKLEPDDQHLIQVLHQMGVTAEGVVWDEPGQDWSRYDLVLLRTCWDYYLKLPAFLNWLEHLENSNLPCLNSVPLVRWNHHKGYLQDLKNLGLSVAPLKMLPKGTIPNLPEWFAQFQVDKLVIKPAVSAGSWNTFVVQRGIDPPQWQEFCRLNDSMDFLVQPFLNAIVEEGELSLVFMGGQFSHAVLKTVGQNDFRVQHQFGGLMKKVDPSDEALALGYSVLSKLPHPWCYARVDLVNDRHHWQVMEVELIEPAMFFEFSPNGLQKFAELIRTKVQK